MTGFGRVAPLADASGIHRRVTTHSGLSRMTAIRPEIWTYRRNTETTDYDSISVSSTRRCSY
jgi:hypothetical protein